MGKPVLAIVKSGPEMAQLGTDVNYNVVVSNKGNAVAQQVVVTDTIPDGLTHSSGQRQLTFQVGDLGSQPVQVHPGDAPGRQARQGLQRRGGGLEQRGQSRSRSLHDHRAGGLKIVKNTNDKQLLINRAATYSIVVSNIGDVPLTGVVVTDTAAPETSIASADGGRASGNTRHMERGPTQSRPAESTHSQGALAGSRAASATQPRSPPPRA